MKDRSQLDPVRLTILERIERTEGITLASVSRAIPRGHAYLHQFIWRGVPRVLPEAVRRGVACALEIDESEIGGPPKVETPPESPADTAQIAEMDARGGAGGPGALISEQLTPVEGGDATISVDGVIGFWAFP